MGRFDSLKENTFSSSSTSSTADGSSYRDSDRDSR